MRHQLVITVDKRRYPTDRRAPFDKTFDLRRVPQLKAAAIPAGIVIAPTGIEAKRLERPCFRLDFFELFDFHVDGERVS